MRQLPWMAQSAIRDKGLGPARYSGSRVFRRNVPMLTMAKDGIQRRSHYERRGQPHRAAP